MAEQPLGDSTVLRDEISYDGSQPASQICESPGRYTELGIQGRGGTGRVLIVVDSLLHRKIALKELRSKELHPDDPTEAAIKFDDALTERFLREARITSRLEHPGIVPIHELGTRANGTPYYTMRLVRGLTLSEKIASLSTMQDRLSLLPHVIDVAQTVAYAHANGIVHRDIKPGNIMIGEFGETVLLDWGLAKEIDSTSPDTADGTAVQGATFDSEITRFGEILGTPAYMAPEQARGENNSVGAPADIHALGAVLYTVLVGRSPFVGKTREDCLHLVANSEAPPIRQIAANCPPELASICMKSLAKLPSARQESAKEFAEDLLRYQSGQRVLAHKYSFLQSSRRLALRHRRLLGVGAAVTVLLAAAAASYAVQTNRSNQRLNRANRDLRWENYISLVKVAQAQIGDDRFVGALESLYKAPKEFRSWEWGYLHRLCAQDVLTLNATAQELGSDGALSDAVLSPNNRYLLTYRPWRSLHTIVDLSTREVVWTSPRIRGARGCTQFLPDGATFCVATDVSEAALFSVPDGRRLTTFSTAPMELRDMVFAPSKHLAAGFAISDTGERKLFVWDSESGQLENQFSLTSTPANVDPRLRIHPDVATRSYEQFSGCLVGFSQDGQKLIVVDEMLRLVDVDDGSQVPLRHATKYIGTKAANTDRVAIMSSDNQIEIWDVRSRSRVSSFRVSDLGDVNDSIGSFSLSPDGTVLAGRMIDPQTRVPLFDATSGERLATYSGHSRVPISYRFSTDGRLLVVSSQIEVKIVPGTPSQLEESRPYLPTWPQPHISFPQNNHYAVVGALSPDGRYVASANPVGVVALWDFVTGRLIDSWLHHSQPVTTLSFSPDSKFLASGATDGYCVIRSLNNDGFNRKWKPAESSAVWNVSVSSSPAHLAVSWEETGLGTGSKVGKVSIFSPEGTRERDVWTSDEALATHILFSPDGKWLVIGARKNTGGSGYIRIYSAPGWELVDHIDGLNEPMSIAFDTHSRKVMSTDLGFTVVGYDLTTRKLLFKANTLDAVAVTVHPDGQRFASFSSTWALVIASASDGREIVTIPEGQEPGLFTPDGYQFRMQSHGHTVSRTLVADSWNSDSLSNFREAQAERYRKEFIRADVSSSNVAPTTR